MEQSDYGKFFITETPRHPDHPQSRDRDSDIPWCDTFYVSGGVNGQVPGAYYLETCMMLRTGSTPDLQVPHTHDFGEYLLFLGTDPDDHFDLHGEVELWVGDEKRTITRTTAVFVPAGVPHCPLVVHRVDRPFMFITTGDGTDYTREEDK